MKLTLPKPKHSVKAWRTLRGKATDAGTGVKSVWLKAVKRGATWFGYNAVRLGQDKDEGEGFLPRQGVRPDDQRQHQWAAKLAKLRRARWSPVRATDR